MIGVLLFFIGTLAGLSNMTTNYQECKAQNFEKTIIREYSDIHYPDIELSVEIDCSEFTGLNKYDKVE